MCAKFSTESHHPKIPRLVLHSAKAKCGTSHLVFLTGSFRSISIGILFILLIEVSFGTVLVEENRAVKVSIKKYLKARFLGTTANSSL
jgi:hypothetical protein